MLILILFAFLAGLITILAPCIWPLLPIVLSSAVAGTGKKRPWGITLGIMTSFAAFTLAISSLVKVLHFDANVLRIAAAVIILLLGVVMIIPKLLALLESLVSRLSSRVSPVGTDPKRGFFGGFLTGLVLGIVWSPCAGPILATIAALSVTGQVTFQLVMITLAYVMGVGIPLYIFTYAGHAFILRSRKLSPYTGRIQQVFGVVMIIAAIGIYTNYDKLLEAKLLNAFPLLSSSLSNFENNAAVTKQLNSLQGRSTTSTPISYSGTMLFNANTPAPEIAGINHWLNSEALTLKELRGKVVLVDFWTYTCINCIRTLPHVTTWYDTYKDNGFVVLGIHTPEFEFEKNTNNVAQAIKQFKINYPVAQDNDFATWNAFGNQYWPAEYLIDAKGNVRRFHFGEGEYDEMDAAIRALLAEAGAQSIAAGDTMPDHTPTSRTLSPETYLGSARSQFYFPDGKTQNGTYTFDAFEQVPFNKFALGGTWSISDEHIAAGKNAQLTYHFTANKVFLVMRPGPTIRNGLLQRYSAKVYLDGNLIDDFRAGTDVGDGTIIINTDRLYNLVNLPNGPESHILKLEFETPGIEAFAFTFG